MAIAWVYILTNYTNKVLYVGSTVDIRTRLWEHRTKQNPNSFTARYNVTKLIYYEGYRYIHHARTREYYIKGKTRQWKVDLINTMNNDWNDLSTRFE